MVTRKQTQTTVDFHEFYRHHRVNYLQFTATVCPAVCWSRKSEIRTIEQQDRSKQLTSM